MVDDNDDDKSTVMKSVMILRNYVSLVLWDFMERGTISIQTFCEFYTPISSDKESTLLSSRSTEF